jgi:ABC-type transport system involved in cytochrome c biogenesis ATPase subunit
MVRPRHGRVLVRGDDYTKARTYQTAQQGIAYVPEGRGIFKSLTVRENLLMSARAGVDGRREWTFDRVMATFPRLGERINNGGWQLSGGEQQMLTIGRALMTNPDLLILDEATEGLAPLIAMEIWRIVKEIRKTGIATVIVDRTTPRSTPSWMRWTPPWSMPPNPAFMAPHWRVGPHVGRGRWSSASTPVRWWVPSISAPCRSKRRRPWRQPLQRYGPTPTPSTC